MPSVLATDNTAVRSGDNGTTVKRQITMRCIETIYGPNVAARLREKGALKSSLGQEARELVDTVAHDPTQAASASDERSSQHWRERWPR